MRLVLNESYLLNKSLKKGYVDTNKPSTTIRVLAKYCLSNGKNKDETYEYINNFLSKNFIGYISVNWYNIIVGIINKLIKDRDYSLIDINNIKITNKEIEKIRLLDNPRLERLTFTLLVYAKIYNQLNNNDKNWVNENHRYIFGDAKVAVTKEEQGKMLHKLKEFGYIDVSVIVDCANVRVNFVDKENEVVIEITDFRNFVYEYMNYFHPEKFIRCEECGKLIKAKNNKMKFCPECAREIKMQMDRERMQKIRNSRK